MDLMEAFLAHLLHQQTLQQRSRNQAGQEVNIPREPPLKHFIIPPSPFRKLFRERGGESAPVITDGQKDEEVDEELDWMEEEEESEPESGRKCRRDGCVKQGASVYCQKCHRAVYCSVDCKKTDRPKHSSECSKHVNFKLVEEALKAEFAHTELTFGKRFGSFKDVPGLEHEFLGGSKTTVVIKLGPRFDWKVFYCQDINGTRTKIKFEELEADIIIAVMTHHDEVFMLVSGASFENLLSTDTRQDIGIVDTRKDVYFYNTSVENSKQVVQKTPYSQVASQFAS